MCNRKFAASVKAMAICLLVIITGGMLLLLSGCKPSEEIPEETDMKQIIIGEGAAEFVIVRSDYADDITTKAAIKLRNELSALAGSELNLKTDWVARDQAVPDDALEILVGATNRAASTSVLNGLAENDYYIGFDGTKLVINAHNCYGVSAAVDYFISEYVKKAESSVLSLENGLSYTAGFHIPNSVKLSEITGTDLQFDYDNGDCATALPACETLYDGEILYLDMNALGTSLIARDSLAAFDAELAVVALQGLANRDAPSVFIRNRKQDNGNEDQWVDGIEADLYWLYVYTNPGQYLSEAEFKRIEWKAGSELEAIEELFRQRLGFCEGLAVWEADVPATMLAACTAAGVDNLIPVRYDTSPNSVYTLLTEKLGLTVKLDLCGKFDGKEGTVIPDTEIMSTGSARNDVYLWAKEKYLDRGLTSPEYISLTRDGASYSETELSYQAPHNTVIAGFDFLISEKAFFFSLSGTNKGIPQDDKSQPAGTDYDTFNKIMAKQYELADGGFYQVSGWPAVSDGESDGTTNEWLTVQLISSYNGVIEMMGAGFASAANTSIWHHVPQITYEQTAKKQSNDIERDTICVMFYMGDYDSVGWLNNVIPAVWESEGRGTVPLAWGIAGIEGERATHVYNYMYQTATENDYFVATNNGAGYLNPMFLMTECKDAQYAAKTTQDGLDAWVDFCTEQYGKYSLDITPFFIPNYQQALNAGAPLRRVLEKYTEFSPAGLGWYNWSDSGIVDIDGTPMLTTLDGANNLATQQQVYENLLGYLTNRQLLQRNKNMLLIREVIVDPQAIAKAADMVREEHPEIEFEVVDPYTFYEVAASRK